MGEGPKEVSFEPTSNHVPCFDPEHLKNLKCKVIEIIPLPTLLIRRARYLRRQGLSWSIAEVCMADLLRTISRNAQHRLYLPRRLGHFPSIQACSRPPSRTLPSLRQITAHAISRIGLPAVPVPISSRPHARTLPRLTEALQLIGLDEGIIFSQPNRLL